MVTRFLTVLAHRLELYGQPLRPGRVLQHVVPLLYPHGIPFDAMDCDQPEQVGAMIYACDWVVRQTDVYDLGGFDELLDLGFTSRSGTRSTARIAWASPMTWAIRGRDAGSARHQRLDRRRIRSRSRAGPDARGVTDLRHHSGLSSRRGCSQWVTPRLGSVA